MTQTTITHSYDDEDQRNLIAPAAAFRAGIRAGRYPTVPGAVQAALDARENLERGRTQLYTDLPERAALPARLLTAVVAGEPVEDALRSAVEIHLEHDRRSYADSLLRLAAEQSETALRDTIAEAMPGILAGLRVQLEETAETLRAAYRDVGALDVHQPDPLEVAQATKKQQTALVTIAEGTRRYRRIRLAQRDALTASSLPIPGYHDRRASYGWKDVFATGVHEVKTPGTGGLPGAGQAPRSATRTVVTRDDLWLPDPDDLTAAYHATEHATVAHTTEATPDPDPTEEFGSFDPGTAAYLDAVSRNNTTPNQRS